MCEIISLITVVLGSVLGAVFESGASGSPSQRNWEERETGASAIEAAEHFPRAAGPVEGDFDGDGDIDRYDFVALHVCQSSFEIEETYPAACGVFDFDADGDLGLDDVSDFMILYHGSLSSLQVEAGKLVPADAPEEGENYYSGEPASDGNGAIIGAAAQGGFFEGDLWFEWLVESQPAGSGRVILHNASRPSTAFTILSPVLPGSYAFRLRVSNLITHEFVVDDVSLELLALGPHKFELTLGQDDFTGSLLDDRFNAPLIFNAPTGTNVPSLQTGDRVDGGGGLDILTAHLNFSFASTLVPTLTSIETLNVSDFGTSATTLQGSGISGLRRVNILNSTNTNAFAMNNLAEVVDAGLDNHRAGLSLSYTTLATMGAVDDMSLSLSNVTGGALTLTTATTNGLEILNITSTGAPNTLSAITQQTGNTLSTINKSGDTSFTVAAVLPSSVTRVNAETDLGGISVDVSSNFSNMTLAGGSGNDTFILGGSYTSGDSVAGGGGADTLGITSATAAVTGNQANVMGIEGLTIIDGLASSVTASRFGNISTVHLRQGFAGAATLSVVAGTEVRMGTSNTSFDGLGSATINVAGVGTTDTLTLGLHDYDHGPGSYTILGVEMLFLQSNGQLGSGAAADGGANVFGGSLTLMPTFGTGTINLSGTESVTFVGAVTAGTVAAGAFTRNVTFTTPSLPAGGVSITTGFGNDTLVGSAGSDLLHAGGGSNSIDGVTGVDNISLAIGAMDTLRLSNFHLNGVDRKLVSGFTTGAGEDVISITPNFGGGGASTLDGTDNFATASSIQAHAAAGNLSVAAATEVVRVTSGTLTNLTDANSLNGTNLIVAIGGVITVAANGNDHVFLAADGSGNVGIYYGDAGADSSVAAGDLTLIAVLQGTTIGNFVFSNFSNF